MLIALYIIGLISTFILLIKFEKGMNSKLKRINGIDLMMIAFCAVLWPMSWIIIIMGVGGMIMLDWIN